MSKTPKRPSPAPRDVHEAIREASAALRSAPRFGVSDAGEYPEVSALMSRCREEVEASIPKSVLFEGRRYWLTVRLSMQVDVYGEPGDAVPLISGAIFSTERHGHKPGH